MFMPGFPGLDKNFYILLSLQKKYLPELYEKFNEAGYTPQLYATKWFMTLFTDFNKDAVARIWDIYILEGRRTIFRFILAILKANEAKLLNASEDQLMSVLASYKDQIDVN